jgi:hypothetical protein
MSHRKLLKVSADADRVATALAATPVTLENSYTLATHA